MGTEHGGGLNKRNRYSNYKYLIILDIHGNMHTCT